MGTDDVGSIVEPTSSLGWADFILADFQSVITRYMQNISTYLSCTAQIVLKPLFMQRSKPKYAYLPNKFARFESIDFASVMIDDVRRRH